MALITCPKCGKQFSEHAKACPQCGITKDEALVLIKKREEEIRIAAEREAAERERQRQEYLAEQERLRKEREAKEAEEARIRAEKRAEWWKKNGKKVWISITVLIALILSGIAVDKIQDAIAERQLNKKVEAVFLSGDSCVNVFAFEEAENFYEQAIELKNDEETRNRVSKKKAELSDSKKKADDDYNAALSKLKILLDADDNEFNRYSNECLDKMIEIYPDKQKTNYYINIRPASLSAVPDYEKQGDELFTQAQYEKAEVKYNAAEIVTELSGQTISAQQKDKKEKLSRCIDLLGKAISSEEYHQYEEAESLYSELYALHQLSSYQAKINVLKRKIKDDAFRKAHANTFVNGHTAVDMGLSVKWADCNIGADSPNKCGNYYAWGETSTKSAYSWNSYKYVSGGKLTKYCTDSKYGKVDNKLVLDISDDAAAVNWGSNWRIPTKEQWEELNDNTKCKWEWTTNNGKDGYKITSKITGNSIFLPITGFKAGGTNIGHPELGLYWSSSLFPDIWNGKYIAAYRFDLGKTNHYCGRDTRSNGRPIRAVCK